MSSRITSGFTVKGVSSFAFTGTKILLLILRNKNVWTLDA